MWPYQEGCVSLVVTDCIGSRTVTSEVSRLLAQIAGSLRVKFGTLILGKLRRSLIPSRWLGAVAILLGLGVIKSLSKGLSVLASRTPLDLLRPTLGHPSLDSMVGTQSLVLHLTSPRILW
jgi:hypothetical protein